MRALNVWLLAYLWLAVGCAHSGGKEEQEAENRTPQPIPADLRAEVEHAARIGRAIYEQDTASALATDLLFEAKVLPDDARIHGWLTLETPDGWKTDFVTEADGGVSALYEVILPKERSSRPDVERFTPPRPLSAEQVAMFRARQTAKGFLKEQCSVRLNPVTLPASLAGKSGWLVYLLASTQDPDLVILGGHERFIVSADGQQVLEHQRLSKGCLGMKEAPGPHGEKPVGFVVSQIVTDWPVETHVFTSFEYRRPLMVVTERGLWRVTGDEIEYLGPR